VLLFFTRLASPSVRHRLGSREPGERMLDARSPPPRRTRPAMLGVVAAATGRAAPGMVRKQPGATPAKAQRRLRPQIPLWVAARRQLSRLGASRRRPDATSTAPNFPDPPFSPVTQSVSLSPGAAHALHPDRPEGHVFTVFPAVQAMTRPATPANPLTAGPFSSGEEPGRFAGASVPPFADGWRCRRWIRRTLVGRRRCPRRAHDRICFLESAA